MSLDSFWLANEIIPSPKIDEKCLANILSRLYGIQGSRLQELNGFYDKNYLVTTKEGGKFVLKVTNTSHSLTPELIGIVKMNLIES